MFTVTKTYKDLPAAHRQPQHEGHCRLIHGHNWQFDITFTCDVLDKNGFVVDVGTLWEVKEFLVRTFDHTLLLNVDDSGIPQDSEAEAWVRRFATIVRVPNCGMEGLAQLVFDSADGIASKMKGAAERKLRVFEVVCWEDSKNRSTYRK